MIVDDKELYIEKILNDISEIIAVAEYNILCGASISIQLEFVFSKLYHLYSSIHNIK